MKILNQKGFTILELLVVIAIIGILSSVILSSLNGARAKANAAKVTSDLSQMMLSYEMAEADEATLSEGAAASVVGPACPVAGNDTIADGSTVYLRLPCPPAGYTIAANSPLDTSAYELIATGFDDGGTFTCTAGACFCDAATKCKQ